MFQKNNIEYFHFKWLTYVIDRLTTHWLHNLLVRFLVNCFSHMFKRHWLLRVFLRMDGIPRWCVFSLKKYENVESRKAYTVPGTGYNSLDTVVVDRAVETSDSLSHKAFIIATYRGMFRLYMFDIVPATLTIYNIVLARGCLLVTNNDTRVRISIVFSCQEYRGIVFTRRYDYRYIVWLYVHMLYVYNYKRLTASFW